MNPPSESDASDVLRREMSMQEAVALGWLPGSTARHPDREGVLCEILRWDDDHWRGRSASSGAWERIFGVGVLTQGYLEATRHCTVVFRIISK